VALALQPGHLAGQACRRHPSLFCDRLEALHRASYLLGELLAQQTKAQTNLRVAAVTYALGGQTQIAMRRLRFRPGIAGYVEYTGTRLWASGAESGPPGRPSGGLRPRPEAVYERARDALPATLRSRDVPLPGFENSFCDP